MPNIKIINSMKCYKRILLFGDIEYIILQVMVVCMGENTISMVQKVEEKVQKRQRC